MIARHLQLEERHHPTENIITLLYCGQHAGQPCDSAGRPLKPCRHSMLLSDKQRRFWPSKDCHHHTTHVCHVQFDHDQVVI